MWYHFIAIGGSAMHNLALDLVKKGNKVTGSDDEIFEPSLSRLKNAGICPEAWGWFPEKINKQIDIVIVGMHARADNPELLKTLELGITYFSYPEFLYEHAKNKKRVVIGGSHGKTTITSMILHVLKHAEKKFDYMVGAQIKGFDRMVSLSDDAPIMIFEGDEYLTAPFDLRPKFHLYRPHIALLSGVAWDHMNVFPTFEKYVEQFKIFVDLIEPNGTLIWYKGDDELNIIANSMRKDIKSLPYKEHAAKIENQAAQLLVNNKKIPIRVFGNHNLQNIQGAKLVCNEIGINDDAFYSAISTFEGANKRLQKIYSNQEKDIAAYLDFAHAPSKVKATIEAVKSLYPEHKIVACLELHTYSSLQKGFLPQYNGSMNKCDVAAVYFNPHALSLKKLPELKAEDIKQGFNNEKINVFSDVRQLFEHLNSSISKKTIILLMSSGNFDNFDLNNWLASL
ncbi:MAG: peptidoglycan synthetase [Bacteroidales bacterium]|jgi:UDP-N-acetylmuramate: L-alanyl-gamma-D-glutamyl-meso-diaminopimelate ligase|nr:peptidoglycan synthetase [Bacteroidales bacterium]